MREGVCWRLLPRPLPVAAVPHHAAAQDNTIIVFAAASMNNALDEVDAAFTKKTGVKVVASYAASSALMKQIEQGAPADVFVSADVNWMDYGAQRNLVRNDTRINLLGNRLVLIAPKDPRSATSRSRRASISPRLPATGASRPEMCARSRPASMPRPRWRNSASGRAVEPKLAMAENVRAALVLVARGEAPLGIVYETDAKVDPSVKIVGVFPEDSHPPIVYPVAMTKDAKPDAAQYLAFLTTPEAKAVFERYGFRVLGKP